MINRIKIKMENKGINKLSKINRVNNKEIRKIIKKKISKKINKSKVKKLEKYQKLNLRKK